MPFVQTKSDFPDVKQALDEPNGLLAIGHELNIDLLVAAYEQGIFPWFDESQPVLWWSPDPRAAFYPDSFKPSRSLKKSLKQQRFTVSVNNDFEQVILRCAEAAPNRPETWINQQMIDAYIELHQAGYAHSVEVWQQQQLVGGLYGVSLGRLFFGESMFHRVSDASKVALWLLVEHCAMAEFALIDCQLPNPHLMSLGAKELPRKKFLDYLYQYRHADQPSGLWRPQVIHRPEQQRE